MRRLEDGRKPGLRRIGQLTAFAALLSMTLFVFADDRSGLPDRLDPHVLPFPASDSALQLRHFGATSLLVTDGQHSLLIDGFFTRPYVDELVFTPLRPDKRRISDALERGRIRNVDAVLVTHAHHDHAMDSGVVAQMTGAVVYGSESVAMLAYGAGLPKNRVCVLANRRVLKIGSFEIQAVAIDHSPGALFSGRIQQPFSEGRMWEYKHDTNFAFIIRHPLGSVLVVPSADASTQAFEGAAVDALLLSIGNIGRRPGFLDEYWRRTVIGSGAKVVVPIHWDDFARPLDEGLRLMPYFLDDVDATLDRLFELSRRDRLPVRFMPLFHPVSLVDVKRVPPGHDR